MVQLAFTRRILSALAKDIILALHTTIETSGFLGDRVDDKFLSVLDLVLLDIKSGDPEPIARRRAAISRRRCVLPSGSPRSASRYGCASRLCPASPMIPPMSRRLRSSLRR